MTTSEQPSAQVNGNNKPKGNVVPPILDVELLSDGESIAIKFDDATFTFHSQWLHDAEVEDGPSKKAGNVYTQTPMNSRICNTSFAGQATKATLSITWTDGKTCRFPAIWLRAYATLVAKPHDEFLRQTSQLGWLASSLVIPEIQYSEICPPGSEKPSPNTLTKIHDILLSDSACGIFKVVGLPDPDIEDERAGDNTLVTQVLKQLFGSVFKHPRRTANTTFNIASHHEKDVKKGATLPNYDTTQLLLPHQDLSHYELPSRIQGLYALEGNSINTFVSCHAVLETFKKESHHLLQYLFSSPTAFGRAAHWYNPPLYQATVDTLLTPISGTSSQIKRFRWHPHLSCSIIAPYSEFPNARLAHQKFQGILLRDTHLVKVIFKPGDMYIWDNFRILHGREEVLSVPRTSVGQTVPEQVVLDAWRVVRMEWLMGVGMMEEKWLVHVPKEQLDEMVGLVGRWRGL